MRILLYCWDAINDNVLYENLKQTGNEIFLENEKCKDYVKDMQFAGKLLERIHKEHIDTVVTLNYFPIISMVCDVAKIKYISWVFDNPHFTLYSKTVFYDCNRIFVFDRSLVERMRNAGVSQVYHMTLAADVERFRKIYEGKKEYQADVSFVGSFYTGKIDYYSQFQSKETVRKQLQIFDDYIANGTFTYGQAYNSQYKGFTSGKNQEALRRFQALTNFYLGEEFFAESEDIIMPAFIEKKITAIERAELFDAIAQENYDFKVYTNSDLKGYSSALQKANCGIVNYNTQMPIVFHNSKINVNQSLKSIHTGIPLRVMDILGCGGFCLSNEQEEILEYFVEDKEIVLYRSKEECLDKIAYYLKHDDLRQQIAKAGQAKMLQNFTYEKLLQKILDYNI